MWEKRDIVSIADLSKDDLLHVLNIAEQLERNPQPTLLQGKVLATLFFEASTRTRLSFESAMLRLGGKVTGFSDASNTSAKKGETLHDTIKVVEGYCDVIAMRHPLEGSARLAAESTKIPVLNAGDGANQHPTQTCLDLYTIRKSKGSLEGLKIAFVGDLKYGRTVHSLIYALAHFGAKMYFVSPKSLKVPPSYKNHLKKKGVEFEERETLEPVAGDLDIIYVTRIQQERFVEPLEYERVKNAYTFGRELLNIIKPDCKILHPLPRVNELHKDLDNADHAIYFEQAHNGVFVRQALLCLVLGVSP